MTGYSAASSTPKPKPKKGEFYNIGPDVTRPGRGHGIIFENEEKLLLRPRIILRPEAGGFPVLSERPHLVYSPEEGDMPRDLEGGLSGYWLVSERLKIVFESIDPQGFAFAACDFTLADGSKGPPYYLCDVTRSLDALDEEASSVRIKTGGYVNGKFYSFAGGASLVFKKEIVGSAQIFHTPYSGEETFCARVLRDALKAAGLKGISLEDVADL